MTGKCKSRCTGAHLQVQKPIIQKERKKTQTTPHQTTSNVCMLHLEDCDNGAVKLPYLIPYAIEV